jgi:hypothetical protein
MFLYVTENISVTGEVFSGGSAVMNLFIPPTVFSIGKSL